MATKTQAPVYVGGDDPESVRLQELYKQAQDRLAKSLEARQQQMFDPALLGAAAGFLNPGKTGSFWESLGSAATGYAKGEQESQKQAQELAQAQMEMAAAGMGVERQRQQDKILRQIAGLPTTEAAAPPTPAAAPQGALQVAPQGALQAAAPQGGMQPAAPQGGLQAAQAMPQPSGPKLGQQIMPRQPGVMSEQDFIRLNIGTMPAPELLAKAQEFGMKGLKPTEGGIYNLGTGEYFASTPQKMVETTIYGYGPNGETQKVEVPAAIAMQLDRALSANDPAAYAVARERAKTGFAQMPAAGAPAAGAQVSAPATGPQAQKSVAEATAESEAGKTLQVGRASMAVKAEEQQPAKVEAAQRAFAAAVDTERIVKSNPTAFGRLKQMGVIPSILNLVSQGVQTPSGGINIKQLDEAVVQATGKEGDLVDRQMAARNMAELTLAFRRQYFSGYGGGAISDMEQAIVNQLSASPQDDPRTILGIMRLVKARSQHDIDEGRSWINFKRQNKKASYNDFIESDDYLARQDKYNNKIGKMFGVEPATPSEKKAPAAKSQITPDAIQAARKRLRGIGE